jgi:hypothetical protein
MAMLAPIPLQELAMVAIVGVSGTQSGKESAPAIN